MKVMNSLCPLKRTCDQETSYIGDFYFYRLNAVLSCERRDYLLTHSALNTKADPDQKCQTL